MPTAVITESSEKMASSTTICATTAQNFAPLRWVGLSLSFLQPLIKLDGRFKQQKQAAKQHN